jgi:hypothetical protein
MGQLEMGFTRASDFIVSLGFSRCVVRVRASLLSQVENGDCA